MTGSHSDLGPELRQLAQSILDRLDPAVRLAAAAATTSPGEPGKCQQVWCPVCALAAAVNGEHHPLLTVIAEHSVALLEIIRGLVDDAPPPPATTPPPPSDPSGPDQPPSPSGPGRYQSIPVTVED